MKTLGTTKFKEGRTYPSAVEGRPFKVKSIHIVGGEFVCMVVYRVTLNVINVMLGVTSEYYLAVVDEDDDSRATVLLDDGFTTIYAEGGE